MTMEAEIKVWCICDVCGSKVGEYKDTTPSFDLVRVSDIQLSSPNDWCAKCILALDMKVSELIEERIKEVEG